MQRLEVSGAVRPLEWTLGVKGLKQARTERSEFCPNPSTGDYVNCVV